MTSYGLGAIPSPPDPRDYKLALAPFVATVYPSAWKVGPPYTKTGLAPTLNQHATGMCTAFAGTGFKQAEELADKHPVLPVLPKWQGSIVGGHPEGYFDVEWLYRQAQLIDGVPMPHEGSTLRAILSTLRNKGLAIVGHPDRASRFKIQSYASVPMTVEGVKSALFQYHSPVLVAVDWPDSWFNPIGGVLPKPSSHIAGGHAFQLFGWRAGQFLGRNSWGPNWGYHGNFYVSMQDLLDRMHDAWKAIDILGD